jgi:hypothetical protein
LVSFLRITFFIFLLSLLVLPVAAQVALSGTVYDSSRKNLVENVSVQTVSGATTVTDSMGRYKILVNEKDSIYFTYAGKSTQKFLVKEVVDPNHFDIRLHITVKGRYSTLQEVVVRAKTYQEDSIENRATYADIYNYRKPGVRTSFNATTGMAGADVNELINVFRFKRNKRLKAFQNRLEEQEQEKYISYRFNKTTVKRITGIKEPQLDDFMIIYRPTYDFLQVCDEVAFNQYVLKCSYQFKAKQFGNNPGGESPAGAQ